MLFSVIIEANFRRDDNDDNLYASDATRRDGESAFERTVVDSKLGKHFEAETELEFIHVPSIVETPTAV